MDEISLLVLKAIRDHLLENPGECDWKPFAEMWQIHLTNLYSHLAFLRMNQFIVQKKGTVYWKDGSMEQVKSALTIAKKISTKDKGEFYGIIPKLEPRRKYTRHEDFRALEDQCVQELAQMSFSGISLTELKCRMSASYDDDLIIAAVKTTGGTVVSSSPKHLFFYKFSTTSPQVGLT